VLKRRGAVETRERVQIRSGMSIAWGSLVSVVSEICFATRRLDAPRLAIGSCHSVQLLCEAWDTEGKSNVNQDAVSLLCDHRTM
jgi:hypothetical protein